LRVPYKSLKPSETFRPAGLYSVIWRRSYPQSKTRGDKAAETHADQNSACRVAASVKWSGGGRLESPLREARGVADIPRPGAPLSTKARFRGPLVAQTPIGRLAQPCGTGLTDESKSPANVPVQRSSSPSVVVPDSACHAGGRGFESRRSRL